jgi:hypothetical protein
MREMIRWKVLWLVLFVNNYRMKNVFIIILLWGLVNAVHADKLKNTIWNISKTECLVVAKNPNDQVMLDSIFFYLKRSDITPEEQYIYQFTAEKLIKKSNKQEVQWDYKEDGNKLIVDMGQGALLIYKYNFPNDSVLILELDKELFFIAEFSFVPDSVKELVSDLIFREYYIKKEE